MKIKSKGKVHPSPSSSSSTASSSEQVVLSVFQLLPAAILALAAVLSLEDREVLAYMVTRSMKTTTSVSSSSPNPKKSSSKKKSSTTNKKSTSNSNSSSNNNVNVKQQHHPMFDCECFDCYRSYWFKWDSSPNREFIHQAIEAFEDHLAHGEKPQNGRSKRRDKMGRREALKSVDITPKDEDFTAAEVNSSAVSATAQVVPVVPSLCDDVVSVSLPERVVEEGDLLTVGDEAVEKEATEAVVVRASAVSNHKGLVRKVLPDVLGLFNSRLWSLWSPNA